MAIRSRLSATGAVVYDDYRDNFVIVPGREKALHTFVNQTYQGQKHKLKATRSSNSEDALTWSCFDTVRHLPALHRGTALKSLWTLAFPASPVPSDLATAAVHIGKTYAGSKATEVDVSIEGDGTLVFIEAKLYSPMSLGDQERGRPDQIAHKLRVGVEVAKQIGAEFYFIVLDIAPKEILRGMSPRVGLEAAKTTKGVGFARKWLTAFWYARYKGGASVTPLREVLDGMPDVDARSVASKMGWLVWADVFKITLRGVLAAGVDAGPSFMSGARD